MIAEGTVTSAKRRMLESLIADGCMLALYDAEADLTKATEKYTPKNEVSGPGYKAGGKPLDGARVEMDGDVACLTFNDVKWPVCSIKASAGLIYNTRTKEAIKVVDLGGPKTASNGPFTVFMPLCSRDTALIRI